MLMRTLMFAAGWELVDEPLSQIQGHLSDDRSKHHGADGAMSPPQTQTRELRDVRETCGVSVLPQQIPLRV